MNIRRAIWLLVPLVLLAVGLPAVMLFLGRTSSGRVAAEPAIIPGVSAADLAAAMDVPGGAIVLADLGTSDPQGVGVADSALAAFPTAGSTFAILATGLAESADDPDTNNDETVSGGGTEDDVSYHLDGLNNSQGNDLVQLTLQLNVPETMNCFTFDFAFFSEEWPDYFESQFNDTFIAEFGPPGAASTFTIVGDAVDAPNNIAFDPAHNVLDVNSGFGFDPGNPNPDTGTTYDGSSGALTASVVAVPDVTIEIVFSVMDLGDSILDSAVFLDNFRWTNVPPELCESGAVPKPTLTMEANPPEGGTTDPPPGPHTYEEPTEVDIYAYPNPYWTFVEWTGDTDCEDGHVSVDHHMTCTANFSCAPVMPGTYTGDVLLHDELAPDGTTIRAVLEGIEWGDTTTSDGHYVMDIPGIMPQDPPCFEGGQIVFAADGVPCQPSPEWSSGLHEVDLICGDAIVRIGSGQGDQSTEVTVPLEALGVTEPPLGAITVDIVYDDSLEPTAWSDDGSPLDYVWCNLNSAPNTISCTGISAAGLSGDILVANLTFHLIGPCDECDPLDAQIVTFADTDGNPIAATDEDGEICINPCPGAATIAIDPPSQEVPSGSFDVLVKEGLDVAGVAFSVDFDPAIIEVDSSTPGSFPPDCTVTTNDIDNSTGHIEFACITTPISGADAPGVVATYNFHCLVDNDSTLLDLEDELVDSNADPITPVTAEDGSIECRFYTDVTIYKADSPDPVGPMKVLTYTLSPENLGPTSAVDVVVEDDLPPEVSFISVTPGSPTCSHDGSPSGGTVTCDLGTLAVGMGPTITIQVEAPLTKVDQDLALDDPPNCASISASNEQPEDTANNEDCEATTCLARCPDVTGDLYISLVDLAKIALHWHHNVCPPDDNWDVCLDLNQDCSISLVDLAKVALHWHETCPSERVVVCPF